MGFIIDKQTLDDLIIFGKGKGNSVYGIFNCTRTRGGALILEDMFRYPLSDVEKINKRSAIIRYFLSREIGFTFQGEWFDAIEHYLENTDSRTRLAPEDNTLQRKIKGYMGADIEYEQLHKGVISGIGIINGILDYLERAKSEGGDNPFQEEFDEIGKLVQNPNLAWAVNEKGVKKLSYDKMVVYDRRLRYDGHDQLKRLLYYIYTMDVYVSVAEVAGKRGFAFAEALPQGEKNVLRIEGVYHPLLASAVPNTMEVDGNNNLIFLTGANMAGKSTFMKSFGIAVFLAHAGFPVPAKRMEFTVQNGMYTTINLPDNLNMGYSHFYAEVLRVKKVAEQVGRMGNLVVIFDELFRGTNVKDAYDATVAVSEAFARKRDCTFMISTHIIEAGDVLRERCDNVNFIYLPTVMKGNTATYPYTLASGITNDRHGMMIINNERIVDILRAGEGKGAGDGTAVFAVDKQTLEDLNMLGKFKNQSVYNVFSHTFTRGGERLLEQMFQQPFADADRINERSGIIEYFREREVAFPFGKELLDNAERYVGNLGHPNRGVAFLNTCRRKFLHHVAKEKEYEMIYTGLLDTIEFLNVLYDFSVMLVRKDPDSVYAGVLKETTGILDSGLLKLVRQKRGVKTFSLFQVARYDHILRYECRVELKRLMQMVYHTDVYITVATAAREKGLTRAMARVMENGKSGIHIADVFHPQLPGAIGNSIRVDHERNVIFLTGANMAGKSTFMKSFGIAVYLAHMGFPVAAKAMDFTVQDGLYTSINVSDNLNLGYSHFYAEVLRVKRVAEEVSRGKNLVIVFDELFKGTNVKDAYDATVAVARAFGENRNCSYIISTHITEAGHTLREDGDNFKFVYLPTVMKGSIPTYTFRLEEGITNDRHGMMIINNERIVEIIQGTV